MADGGVSLTVEGYLIVVGILHRSPFRCDTIRLDISFKQVGRRQDTLLS